MYYVVLGVTYIPIIIFKKFLNRVLESYLMLKFHVSVVIDCVERGQANFELCG